MSWNVGTKIGAGFALVLTIFVLVATVAYRNVTRQTAAADWVAHTHEVQYELLQLMLNVQDAERGERGYVITGVEDYLAPYLEGVARLEDSRGRLAQLIADNSVQAARAEALAPLIAERLAQLKEVINLRKTRDFAAAQSVVLTDVGRKTMLAIHNGIQGMYAEENALLKRRTDAAQADALSAQRTILFGTLLAVVLGTFIGFVIARHVAGPLRNLSDIAERISVGELNITVAADRRTDEVGVLTRMFERMTRFLSTMAGVADQIAGGDLRTKMQPQSPHDQLGTAFARMIDNLRRQISAITEGVTVLGTSANEIVASTAQLASSATESAVAVSQTTTTVEEVRQTVQLNSQKVKTVVDSAQKAAQISHNGRKSSDDAIAGMGRIRTQMEAIGESMIRLSEQSQTIGQIIATVEDLAAQSNLLAVNAAIEAAKAGEHGKGFGVVAQEVKSLAEQSRQATDRVRSILGDIQKATTAAVMATEQGGKAVEAGARQTEVAGESIGSLAGSVAEAAQAATQIATSSQQQLIGMDQVAGAMENIKQSSAQNVASARQLESAARNLNDLGQRLKHLAEGYAV